MEINTDSGLVKEEQQIVVIDQHSNWTDVPNELLCDIFSRLVAGDRIMFQLACTWWKSVTQVKPISSPNTILSPCLMMPNNTDNKLFNPIHQQYHQTIDDFRQPAGVVWAVKDGWLLMTHKRYEIFFYNPFTRKQVKLPHIEIIIPESMCFSSPPTSADWVVVVLEITREHIIRIDSLGCQDESWNRYEVQSDEDYGLLYGCYWNTVIYKGLYYFLGRDAKLLIHDPSTKKFDFHKAPESISQLVSGKGAQHYMLESNGKVLAIFVNTDGSTVYTCQWINGAWETLSCLEGENNMLFVSRRSSFCQRSTVKGTGNKIYFPRFVGKHSIFYSLSSKRYHTFEMGSSYESFHGSKLRPHSTWIKPSYN